ncbi:DUF4268 domain-containing protein [Variovorax sp. J22R133]|uniref:DUF4268 domain-containing protein n=1 Tax=Variovorax brevis TaxID=3053503 RepID=UPI00257902B0|nr:DUF4268 domain-containing protein [Variovorax sp. J22R133]MDM0118007.1 DUF4268 domain-containing protein [Variovorax sp. J22R133]
MAAKQGSGSSASGEDSAALRERFWTGLLDYLTEQHPTLDPFEVKSKHVIRLQSGVKSIAFEMRYLVKPATVAIHIAFWRASSLAAWDSVQEKKDELDAAVDDVWEFGRPDDDRNPRWMTLKLDLASTSESEWPAAYAWFGRKHEPLFTKIAPLLRDEMARAVAA